MYFPQKHNMRFWVLPIEEEIIEFWIKNLSFSLSSKHVHLLSERVRTHSVILSLSLSQSLRYIEKNNYLSLYCAH